MMIKQILVTGAAGFLGRAFLDYCQNTHATYDVIATDLIPLPKGYESFPFEKVDLNNHSAVQSLIDSCLPDAVIHFAATISGQSIMDLLQANVGSTEGLYDILGQYHQSHPCRVIQISSAAVYGPVNTDDLPVRENMLPQPISPYALSKLTQEYIAHMAHQRYQLPIVIARIFNLIGLDQPQHLVPMTFVRQFQNIKKGLADHIETGNTETTRDFIDCRDVPPALLALLEMGQPGDVYNIASGQEISIQQLIDMLMEISGTTAPIIRKTQRLKSADIPTIRADIAKIKQITKWLPQYPIHQSLEYLWQYS